MEVILEGPPLFLCQSRHNRMALPAYKRRDIRKKPKRTLDWIADTLPFQDDRFPVASTEFIRNN